jgi:hypothetical protein
VDTLKNVRLNFQHKNGSPPITIQKFRQNSLKNFIRGLLSSGYKGNKTYYRDNDKRLTLKVWEREGLHLSKDQRRRFLHEVTPMETISRRRREMRAEYPESEVVMKKRFRLFLDKKDEYSKGGILNRIRRPR